MSLSKTSTQALRKWSGQNTSPDAITAWLGHMTDIKQLTTKPGVICIHLQGLHHATPMDLSGHVCTKPTLMSLTKAGVQVFSASLYSFCMSSVFGLMVTEWLPSFGSGASLYLQPSLPSLSVMSSCKCHASVQLQLCSVCALASKCMSSEHLLLGSAC